MSHTYEKVSGNKAKLTFTIPAVKFDEALQQAFDFVASEQGEAEARPEVDNAINIDLDF